MNCLGRFELLPWKYVLLTSAFLILPAIVVFGIHASRRARQGEQWVLWAFGGYTIATAGTLIYYLDVIRTMFSGNQVGMVRSLVLVSTPFTIDAQSVGQFLSGSVMAGILGWRLYLLMKASQSMAAELEAAKQVQDLLLPQTQLVTPGFLVESAYLPASQVGGDFYYIQPLPNGELLVVVGDVSGKGLRAAMVVSVVVGILRTVTAKSPSSVLEVLNARLQGRTGGGFVTACCVLFDVSGNARVANAGHCPVYRNGVEVDVEASLPLGVVEDANFHEATMPSGHFTLLSDGVVEAANAKGELFGFERTRSASEQNAKDLAEAARTWGQTDDITVVTVRRTV